MNKPIQSAIFKAHPSDFIVTEILPQADNLSAQGEHLWLYIQKQGVNTIYAAKLLAEFARIGVHHVGYSGLKDRYALTHQWFSLHLPKSDINLDKMQANLAKKLQPDEHIRLIRAIRHHKKLNKGTHKHNHFKIVLREVVGEQTLIDTALMEISRTGVPNFFGQQRFGHDGGNLNKAAQLLAKYQKYPKQKIKLNQQHALLISAIRSHLFNQILARRVADNTWNQPLKGDVFNLNNTNSLFVSTIDNDIIHRIKIGDIHPTAPLFGQNRLNATLDALAIEQQVLTQPDNAIWIKGLDHLGILGDRRALRMMVDKLTWRWLDITTLELDFYLPTGSFATSVLDYIIATPTDSSIKNHQATEPTPDGL